MAVVLVIEDDDHLRGLLRAVLERAGHTVEDAPNGAAGLKRFYSHPADVVVTDIIMPEKEGLETIIELKRDHPEVKIIAISGGGARLDAYYYCPHHPDGTIAEYAKTCACRKPGRGLVDRAASDLGIDPARSFTVGDRWVDIGLARAIGGRGVLLRTGYGRTEETRPPDGLAADAIVDNLAGAASWILGQVITRQQLRP